MVKSGEIPRRELLDAMQQMDRAGSPIHGTVLNEYDDRKYGGGYYCHKSYYAQYDGTKKRKHSFLFD